MKLHLSSRLKFYACFWNHLINRVYFWPDGSSHTVRTDYRLQGRWGHYCSHLPLLWNNAGLTPRCFGFASVIGLSELRYSPCKDPQVRNPMKVAVRLVGFSLGSIFKVSESQSRMKRHSGCVSLEESPLHKRRLPWRHVSTDLLKVAVAKSRGRPGCGMP